jgi:DNA topoisomerase IB
VTCHPRKSLGRAGPAQQVLIGAIREAVDAAAAHLRNTRAMCRASYPHPDVLEAFRDGELDHIWQQTRRSNFLARSERALVRLLTTRASR